MLNIISPDVLRKELHKIIRDNDLRTYIGYIYIYTYIYMCVCVCIYMYI